MHVQTKKQVIRQINTDSHTYTHRHKEQGRDKDTKEYTDRQTCVYRERQSDTQHIPHSIQTVTTNSIYSTTTLINKTKIKTNFSQTAW